ncbi:MAG: phosphatase PAP2 family protein [Candidatus Thioglobus sp.]
MHNKQSIIKSKARMTSKQMPRINGNYLNYIKLLSRKEILILVLVALSTAINGYTVFRNIIQAQIGYGGGAIKTTALFPIFLCLITIGKAVNIKTGKKPWLILCAAAFTMMIFFSGLSGIAAMASTPHTRIDASLEKFDLAMHFNLAATMNWINNGHDRILSISNFAYHSWLWQLLLLPTVITVIGSYKRVITYMLGFTIACAIGGGIYYFWPTTAPATVVHSHYFTQDQYNLVKDFIMMRQGATKLLPTEGLISFPSFRVIGAVLFMILCWKNKIILIPIVVLNLILIYATLALGYHYLADVLAGIIIAVFSYYISSKIKY